MATLARLYTATDRASEVLLPISSDSAAVALSTAQRFGPFVAGDSLVVASTAAFHVLAGDGSVTATTTNPKIQAGVYKFTVPDGCTYVSMIDGISEAGIGQAYKG